MMNISGASRRFLALANKSRGGILEWSLRLGKLGR
jgi:hypothetical protein